MNNRRKFAVGLILQNGSERSVMPGSFVMLSRDEIEYLASIAPKLFEGEKMLQLEDRAVAVEMGFIESAEQPVMDEDEIRKRLSQRVPQLKAWLATVQEGYLLDAICDVADKMDLPASKLQLLQERMPERNFLGNE